MSWQLFPLSLAWSLGGKKQPLPKETFRLLIHAARNAIAALPVLFYIMIVITLVVATSGEGMLRLLWDHGREPGIWIRSVKSTLWHCHSWILSDQYIWHIWTWTQMNIIMISMNLLVRVHVLKHIEIYQRWDCIFLNHWPPPRQPRPYIWWSTLIEFNMLRCWMNVVVRLKKAIRECFHSDPAGSKAIKIRRL